MARIAIVFAGQGAQSPGMGLSLAEVSPAAREVFRLADSIRPGTSGQCFSGSAEELALTINTQPCLWTVGMAAAAALTERGMNIDMAAGFSLGELAALTFSEAVDFETGFRLVCRRAELMDRASQKADAAMAAVMKLDADTVERLCAEYEHVWPVNYNCPGQITVSGLREELLRFIPAVKEAGGIAKLLKVSGAFHSPLMEEAAVAFANDLAGVTIHQPRIPLYANYTGRPYDDDPRLLLTKQICNPVRWQTLIENMASTGIDCFVEVGPGRTLTNLISRILPRVSVFSVADEVGLTKALEVLNG